MFYKVYQEASTVELVVLHVDSGQGPWNAKALYD
jgi:hypothetical protein